MARVKSAKHRVCVCSFVQVGRVDVCITLCVLLNRKDIKMRFVINCEFIAWSTTVHSGQWTGLKVNWQTSLWKEGESNKASESEREN